MDTTTSKGSTCGYNVYVDERSNFSSISKDLKTYIEIIYNRPRLTEIQRKSKLLKFTYS